MTETALTSAEIYRARPTLRLAGAEDERASEVLIGMRMEECEGGMSTVELRLSNWASLTGGSQGSIALAGPTAAASYNTTWVDFQTRVGDWLSPLSPARSHCRGSGCRPKRGRFVSRSRGETLPVRS